MTEIKVPKKLIEVALPLDAINAACAYEKMPGIGAHPRGIHLWWARRPLAAARAVIFSQMVNDPGYERNLQRGMNKEKAAAERERLFRIIEKLVLWENINNKSVLDEAREEIKNSWRETCALNKNHSQAEELFDPEKLPGFHDPFSGGGAIPLEAQRLGLEAFASDLNPVAVGINKAMIEIPPRFRNREPVGPLPKNEKPTLINDWEGLRGFSEDLRRYGAWINEEALKRIGNLYPKYKITTETVEDREDLKSLCGRELSVVAWLWARTVKSPNPAFSHIDVPLISSFVLASKSGKEVYIEPVIQKDDYSFKVKIGPAPAHAKNGTKASGSGSSFLCLMSKSPIDFKYIRDEAKKGRLGQRLVAVVAEGKRRKVYLPSNKQHEQAALVNKPDNLSDTPLPAKALGFRVQEYGMLKWADLFTNRQLVALTTLSDLISETIDKIKSDLLIAKRFKEGAGLEEGGAGGLAYAEAIGLYLAFAVDRCADFSNTCTRWVSSNEKVMNLFGKQAIAMTWDFPEASILEETVGGFYPAVKYIAECLLTLPLDGKAGFALQENASTNQSCIKKIISTDPPYYDNIGYADLSDFFYFWLRRSLKDTFKKLYSTIAVPKIEELVATPFRHGSKDAAEQFFLEGMTQAMHNLAQCGHPTFPVTIYYAFKQSETETEGTASTGWETFLDAVLKAGFSLTGTWPMRSEQSSRMVSMGTNALASSIVLVCRKRDANAATISRREFVRELNALLPEALDEMTRGGVNSPVAPVDLSQAIIGPGMAVFSKYAAVLEADGKPMTVKTALQLINRFLAEDDFDHDSQFCLHWFENYGWGEGKFGDADVLARAKGTSVSGVQESGVLASSKSVVKLMRFSEYPKSWDPEEDKRIPVWEALHQLVRVLQESGESAAGELLAKMPGRGESIRQLAYRLHTLCERKGWSDDARAYNELITSWNAAEAVSQTVAQKTGKQMEMGI